MNSKTKKIMKVLLITCVIIIITISVKIVLADEIVSQVNFNTEVASGGGKKKLMDTKRRIEADYLKVDIKAKAGDKYDIKFVYSDNFMDTTKTIAIKKGLDGDDKRTIIYFIPKKGKCPGKKNQCVKIPVIDGISTEKKLIDSDEIIYGIEIYNGSLLGWTLKLEGTYYFAKFEEK